MRTCSECYYGRNTGAWTTSCRKTQVWETKFYKQTCPDFKEEIQIYRCSKCGKMKYGPEMATTWWYDTGTCKECVQRLYLKVDAKLKAHFKKG